MARLEPELIQPGSEGKIRAGLGYLLLVLVPPLLLLVVMAAKFQGLQDFTALDHAQVARHLAAGDGFVTSLIRPLSVGFKGQLANHPDLYNAPGHPLLLSLFYR